MKNAAGKRNFLAGPLHSLPYFSCDATASHSLPANRAGIGLPLSVAVATVTAIAVAVAALLLPGRRVQDQAFVRTAVREVEHAVDRAGYRVKRAATDAFALEPIVFDEADDRRLVDDHVIDVILLRERRDHQERQARTVTAASLSRRGTADPRQRGLAVAAGTRAGEGVGRSGGLVEERAVLVIVPTVGVVIRDDDGGAGPVRRLLERVDHGDHPGLLIERVGVTGVAILIARRLQERDGGKNALAQRGEEIRGVVLVVGRTGVSDFIDRSRTRVSRVRGGSVILKRLVVRNVVSLGDGGDARGGGALALRGAVGVHRREIESSLEEAPADARVVQQVADVLAAHAEFFAGRSGADVTDRIGVADHGRVAVAAIDDRAGAVFVVAHAVGLAGDQVQRAVGGGTEVRVIRVVAHCEVLRIVPVSGDGVAVVVAHHETGGIENRRSALSAGGGAAQAGVLRIEVHAAEVVRLLLGRVVVILVRGGSLGRREAERIRCAVAVQRIRGGRVIGEQRAGKAVDRWRVLCGRPVAFALQILGVGVAAEVVVERNVLLKDHDDVLDRGGRLGTVAVIVRRGGSDERGIEEQSGGKQSGNNFAHFENPPFRSCRTNKLGGETDWSAWRVIAKCYGEVTLRF